MIINSMIIIQFIEFIGLGHVHLTISLVTEMNGLPQTFSSQKRRFSRESTYFRAWEDFIIRGMRKIVHILTQIIDHELATKL